MSDKSQTTDYMQTVGPSLTYTLEKLGAAYSKMFATNSAEILKGGDKDGNNS